MFLCVSTFYTQFLCSHAFLSTSITQHSTRTILMFIVCGSIYPLHIEFYVPMYCTVCLSTCVPLYSTHTHNFDLCRVFSALHISLMFWCFHSQSPQVHTFAVDILPCNSLLSNLPKLFVNLTWLWWCYLKHRKPLSNTCIFTEISILQGTLRSTGILQILNIYNYCLAELETVVTPVTMYGFLSSAS